MTCTDDESSMTEKTVIRLQPLPHNEIKLHGLYLNHQLHQIGSTSEPFVYANFLSSIDGRIAVTDPATGLSSTPRCLTSIEDFRLFQELQAQADCMITHGGYMRSLASGRLGNILQVGLRKNAHDLASWRLYHGLTPQPDLVIASSSLDFTIPASLANHQQKVIIATDTNADPKRIQYWQQRGYEVMIAGNKMVDGGQLTKLLAHLGYQTLYLIAGPQMLATMIHNQKLQRLYLTVNHQLLGGETFHTLIPGSFQQSSHQLNLIEHYYDVLSSNHHGQFYSCYQLDYQKPVLSN